MHEDINTLDFAKINDALLQLNAEIEAAEFHSAVCGMLCAIGASDGLPLDKLIPKPAAGDVVQQEAFDLLNRCTQLVLQQLNDPECGLQLLLPDEDQDLQTRTEALSDWCHGFLVGMTDAGISDFSALPEEAAEFCQDLLEISKVGHYPQDDTEEDEAAYEELIEYIRMGVLLINELLNPAGDDLSPNRKLH